MESLELEKMQVLDSYFKGGIPIDNKKEMIKLALSYSISIDKLITMCIDFANGIHKMYKFERVQREFFDYVERGGDFSEEYWEERRSNPYDWLRCSTPKQNLGAKYFLSTVFYYGWENLQKFEIIVPTSKIDIVCKNIALFAKDNISEKYLEGKTILNEIVERIQLTGNYGFEDIILTTVSHNNLHVFDILSSDLVSKLKDIVEA